MKESKKQSSVVLEQSTNTHQLHASNVVSKDLGNGTIKLKIEGEGVVTHGEHGTVKIESENVIKYVQQEVNPVTKKMQAVFDQQENKKNKKIKKKPYFKYGFFFIKICCFV